MMEKKIKKVSLCYKIQDFCFVFVSTYSVFEVGEVGVPA